ncbi:MAG: GntR family transcriptional regulator [Lentisphaeria bacterium]|nr:GntR family transcriptional regulator [Lentisphaeria bacterium]
MNTPKYSKVQYGILNLIAERNLMPGDRIPPEKELSSIFGVSIVTVRSAAENLERQGFVSREQGRGTIIRKKLEEQPRLGEIAYLEIREKLVQGPVFRNTLVDLTQFHYAAGCRGYNMRYLLAGKTPDQATVKSLQNVSGVLVWGYINQEWINVFRSLDMPIVLVGALYTDCRYDFPHVDIDWEAMTGLAVDYHVRRGCRKIILAASVRDYEPTRHIAAGFRAAMKRHRLPVSPELICIPDSDDENMPFQKLLEQCPDADAIIVEQGKTLRILAALLELRREMPFLGIVGTFHQSPGLNRKVIHVVPDEDLCEKAIHVLMNEITRPDTEKKQFLISGKIIQEGGEP